MVREQSSGKRTQHHWVTYKGKSFSRKQAKAGFAGPANKKRA